MGTIDMGTSMKLMLLREGQITRQKFQESVAMSTLITNIMTKYLVTVLVDHCEVMRNGVLPRALSVILFSATAARVGDSQ